MIKQISAKLLREMREGEFCNSQRLPREIELAKQMNVSRTLLRDVLAHLEQEGFVTRIHGVGTVINHHVIQVKNRMDIETEFLDIILQNGYQSKISDICVREEKADKYISEKLQIGEGTEIIRVCRVCTADGTRALYCEDVLEKRLIKEEYTLDDFRPSIFQFLKKCCQLEVYMDLTQLHAVAANEVVASALALLPGTPVLNMEEVDYDIWGKPVFYSSQFFVDRFFEHTVMRKKL